MDVKHISAPLVLKKKEADTRPTVSKKWQENEADALLAFLEACGYNQHLTKQSVLQGLNAKDFTQVLNFLLRGFDAMFYMNGKLDSEVTEVIKALHYPFPPSRTALTAIGASHSWPAFLGLLSWLRELLQYDRAVQQAEMSMEAAQVGVPGTPSHLWGYLQVAYTQYLAGADDEIAATEAGISAQFDAMQAAEEAEEQQLQVELQGLLGQLGTLQEQKVSSSTDSRQSATFPRIRSLPTSPPPFLPSFRLQSYLPSLRASVAELSSDVSSLSSGMAQVDKYSTEMDKKVAEKQAAVVEAQQHLESLQRRLESITAAVATQELSQEDVRKLRSQAQALRDRQAVLSHRKQTVAAETQQLQLQLRTALEQLDSAVNAYHEGARSLQMIPKGAKYSMGCDFSLHVDERALGACAEPKHGSSEGDLKAVAYALLGQDMKVGIKEKIRYLRGLLVKKAADSRGATLDTGDACAELSRARETIAKALAEAEATQAAAAAAVQAEAAAVAARLADGSGELSKAESLRAQKRAEMLQAASSRAELSAAVLAELESSIEHMAAAQAGERARLADAVSRLVVRIEEHRRSVVQRLAACAISAQSFKEGQKLQEAARAARLIAPIALTATPAAASASIAAGASMLLANQSMSLHGGHTLMGGAHSGIFNTSRQSILYAPSEQAEGQAAGRRRTRAMLSPAQSRVRADHGVGAVQGEEAQAMPFSSPVIAARERHRRMNGTTPNGKSGEDSLSGAEWSKLISGGNA